MDELETALQGLGHSGDKRRTEQAVMDGFDTVKRRKGNVCKPSRLRFAQPDEIASLQIGERIVEVS